MISKITNWTIGSFFRTIGRIIAYIVIGFLIFLVATNKTKAYSIQRKYKSFQDIVYNSNNNVSNCSLSGNGNIINLNNSGYLKNYYFIYKDDYNNSLSDNTFKVFTSDTKFYVVINKASITSNSYYINAYNQKTEITESVFNSYLTDPIQKYRIYYDSIDNKYYWFNQYVNQYLVTNSNSQLISTDSYATYLFSTNISELYFASNNNNNPLKLGTALNTCFTNTNNIISYLVNFKLNGGWLYGDNSNLPLTNLDYSLSFYDSVDLSNYLNTLHIKKDGVNFTYWYRDKTLTIIFDSSQAIEDNMNLYAGYEYTDIDLILSNVTFYDYTFPSDNQYAIINVTRNYGSGCYLAFDFDYSFMTAYRYNLLSSLGFDSTMNFSSIASRNNKYYFWLGGSVFNDNQTYVVVLDKQYMKALNDQGVLTEYYSFQVSDNAVVTFTNDLTEVTFDTTTGDTITANLYDAYETNEQLMITNTSDIWTILRQTISSNDKSSLYNTFKSLWGKFNGTYLSNYLFLLMTAVIIVLVFKVSSRK